MLFTSRYSATATQRTVVLEVVKLRAAKCMATEKKNYLTLILQRSYQVEIVGILVRYTRNFSQ